MESILNSTFVLAAILGFIYLIKQHKISKFDTRTWIFSILALVFIPFGLAWGITSFYEHEPQAGWVGIFVFTGLGFVFFLLARKGIFPSNEEKPKSGPIEKLGYKIAIILLLAIGILTLPFGLLIKKSAKIIADKEQVTELFSNNMLSDEALPKFVKKTLAYETLYGEYPETLEIRMMQSMFSGVKSDEMVKLFGYILPEHKRLELFNNGTVAVTTWLNTNAAYPELELKPTEYLANVNTHAEDIARWFYKNFSLPPMSDEIVAKFESGEFSNNMKDYMGTPPEHIKEALILPFADLVRSQLDSVEIPAKVSLAEEMSKTIPAEEMLANKEKLKKIPSMLGKLWLVPLFLIIAGCCLVFVAKLNWLKWSAWTILAFGIRLIPYAIVFGKPQAFINDMIPNLAEKAPAPALALVQSMFPKILAPTGHSFVVFAWILVFAGLGLVVTLYFNNLKKSLLR